MGSDTLANLMATWGEGFQAIYPNVNVQAECKGSSTAPPALIEGLAQLGPMSRPMKASEIDDFEKKFGYKPTEIHVAIDALAVFVHKDNPVKGLTVTQLDSIFASTRKHGGPDISTWGQVGLEGPFAELPMSLYGRNSASGTYGAFKKEVLQEGDFKSTVKEQPGSSSVVQGIASELGGIGYSGIGYITSDVRAVPLGREADHFIDPTVENCIDGSYPLGRFLDIYINKAPGKELDPLTRQFLTFVLSKKGQETVARNGFYPLPAAIAAEQLKSLE